MEQLGIWNLLKTMLNNTPSPSTQTAKTAENQTENTPSVTKSAPPENGATIQEQESKETPPTLSAKACEEYLLRHERLKNQRKK